MKAIVRLHPTAAHKRNITSVGQAALSRLTPAAKGRVHSAYRGAANLLLPAGLVSIVPPSAGRGPLNLILEDWSLVGDDDSGFKTGQRIVIEDKVIRIAESECLSFAHAQVYRPDSVFKRKVLAPGEIRRNVKRASDLIRSEGRLEGFGGLLPLIEGSTPVTPSNPSPFMPAALRRATRIVRALESKDTGQILRTGKGLVGLGIGLTPSGDDFLCGVFVALVLGSQNGFNVPRAYQPVFARIARAEGRTTLLGQEYLEQASQGKANERLTDLVSAVFASNEDDVEKSLSALLAMGETSGTDTALGVILGVKVALRWARRETV